MSLGFSGAQGLAPPTGSCKDITVETYCFERLLSALPRAFRGCEYQGPLPDTPVVVMSTLSNSIMRASFSVTNQLSNT